MIPVNQSFIAAQGEGYRAGLMTIFLRLAGCNFAIAGHPCQYPCDTPYAHYPSQGTLMTVGTIVDNLRTLSLWTGIEEICITGGEPLMHLETGELIHRLRRLYRLSVETNGSYSIWKDEHTIWSLDIKCPSSGNAEHNFYQNLELLTHKDQVKFVIANRDDFNFARDIVRSRIVLTNVIFQPVWRQLSHSRLIEWVKEDRDIAGKVRIGDQLQKRWYPRKKRGI